MSQIMFRIQSQSFIRKVRLVHISSPTSKLPATESLAPPPPRTKSLSGTVPHHTSYLLLHSPQPPASWPSIFLSRLYFELQRKFKEHGGLVNFCWEPNRSLDIHPVTLGESGYDSEETYSATFWKIIGQGEFARRIEIPLVSTGNLEEILSDLFLDNHALEGNFISQPYFYVCTHGARDCRCGVRGGEFAESLRKELRGRGMLFDQAGRSRVSEVGHVGGHKNAPNVIVFPQGDWYGNLELSDISPLLDHWFQSSEQPQGTAFIAGPNHLQWRGRMGMTREDQEIATRTE